MAATAHVRSTVATDDGPWRRLVLAAWLFLVGSAIHVVDHMRRGQASVTGTLYVAGNVALVVQVAIITLVLARHRWAPFVATAGGFGLALGFAAAHWLPTWGELSDSFVDRPTAALSYAGSTLEILGALAVGICGLLVLRADHRDAAPA